MRKIFLVLGVVVLGLGLSACAGSPTAPSASPGSFTSRGGGAGRGNQPNDNNGQNGNHYGQEKNGNNKDGEKHEEVPTTTTPEVPPATTTPEIPPTTTTPTAPSGITQPALSVSARSVAGGESVTVTLTNGPGGTYDWLALAATGSENTSYGQWTYIGAGVTTFSWTVTMPTTAGNYEFRLFLNGVYTLAATSPSITVTVAGPSLSVSALTAAGGSPVTVTLRNGIGGAYDWLTLAPAGASDGTYLQWTYIGAGVTTFSWTVAMPMTAGTYEFRLFLNGGYTRAATSSRITVN